MLLLYGCEVPVCVANGVYSSAVNLLNSGRAVQLHWWQQQILHTTLSRDCLLHETGFESIGSFDLVKLDARFERRGSNGTLKKWMIIEYHDNNTGLACLLLPLFPFKVDRPKVPKKLVKRCLWMVKCLKFKSSTFPYCWIYLTYLYIF